MNEAAQRWQHVKRGTTYTIVGVAELQTGSPLEEGAAIVVYRCEQTDMLWCRPASEFYDGRFAALPFAKPAAPVTDEGFEKQVLDFECAVNAADSAYAVQAARTRLLTAHAEAIKAAEARGMERTLEALKAQQLKDEPHFASLIDGLIAAMRTASKTDTGEAS